MKTHSSSAFKPAFFNRKNSSENNSFKNLISQNNHLEIFDLFENQKIELLKTKKPREKLSYETLQEEFQNWIKSGHLDIELEGVWVFYPWSNRLIHILEKEEFIELRTSRNRHKITDQEQAILLQKKIGIIGLSVGNAVAITMASERICGHIKLADFDTLELSNMNRIRTGLHNIGINKCVITAREIAEIDPFIKVECYTEGIHVGNISSFLFDEGKLDILVDECDDLQIKILARLEAQKNAIPVIMETSDRGMLDIERFDLEENRAILHGLLSGIPHANLINIQPEQRLPLVMKIINAPNTSPRGLASLLELGKTIGTWPQLASAVTLGGGVVTDLTRRILLNKFTSSGRFYVDLEQLIQQPVELKPIIQQVEISDHVSAENGTKITQETFPINQRAIENLISQASKVPSLFNMQPWKWVLKNNTLSVGSETSRTLPFWDSNGTSTQFAIGSAVQIFISKAKDFGINCAASPSTKNNKSTSICFNTSTDSEELAINYKDIKALTTIVNSGEPSEIFEGKITSEIDFISIHNPSMVALISKYLGQLELLGILNPAGHQEYFNQYLKTDQVEDNEGLKFGKNIGDFPFSPEEKMAFSMLKSPSLANAVKEIGHGEIFWTALSKQYNAALAFVFIKRSGNPLHDGRIIQSVTTYISNQDLQLETIFFTNDLFQNLEKFNKIELLQFEDLNKKISTFTEEVVSLDKYYVIQIFRPDSQNISLLRLPLNEILLVDNSNN